MFEVAVGDGVEIGAVIDEQIGKRIEIGRGAAADGRLDRGCHARDGDYVR